MYHDCEIDIERARVSYDEISKKYPNQVKESYNLVVQYLSRYDKKRMRVFLGHVEDQNFDLGDMCTAHRLISSILYARDSGVEVDEFTLDKHCRAYLYLPFASIDGGKKD